MDCLYVEVICVLLFCTGSMVVCFVTVVYICVLVTCPTFCCLCDMTQKSALSACVCQCVYVLVCECMSLCVRVYMGVCV
jgi:hypothetical protein